jgi:diaminohydroxyphosphoribosylaminopyrimidine deaminase/5-amino-6-(5-phosphoribosylamino)uracil reductase
VIDGTEVRMEAGQPLDLMARALELAGRADHQTSPNPMVGAVLVRDGVVVGEGYHVRAGLAHAEVVALEAAGPQANGASLWVTLEPCCIQGRTPPCTERVLEAGVAEVHIATLDPNPRVHGRGLARLRGAGVKVILGERREEADTLIEEFAAWMTTGRPWVTLKFAMSLDGKVATSSGESQWITSEEARMRGHQLRCRHDAVMVGSGTVLADDPRLTARWGTAPAAPDGRGRSASYPADGQAIRGAGRGDPDRHGGGSRPPTPPSSRASRSGGAQPSRGQGGGGAT